MFETLKAKKETINVFQENICLMAIIIINSLAYFP